MQNLVVKFSKNKRLYNTNVTIDSRSTVSEEIIDSFRKNCDPKNKLTDYQFNKYMQEIEHSQQKVIKYSIFNMPLFNNYEIKCAVSNSLLFSDQRGLIATSFIPAGTFITNYPPHWMISNELHFGKIQRTRVIDTYRLRMDVDYPKFFSCSKYIISLEDDYIVGDPEIIDNPKFIGHLANDSLNTGLPSNSFFQLNYIN